MIIFQNLRTIFFMVLKLLQFFSVKSSLKSEFRAQFYPYFPSFFAGFAGLVLPPAIGKAHENLCRRHCQCRWHVYQVHVTCLLLKLFNLTLLFKKMFMYYTLPLEKILSCGVIRKCIKNLYDLMGSL